MLMFITELLHYVFKILEFEIRGVYIFKSNCNCLLFFKHYLRKLHIDGTEAIFEKQCSASSSIMEHIVF